MEHENVDVSNVVFDEKDDIIANKLQRAVGAAMRAKKAMAQATDEAIDASSEFGYELGALDMRDKIIEAFEADDSACVDWALGIIRSVK